MALLGMMLATLTTLNVPPTGAEVTFIVARFTLEVPLDEDDAVKMER